MTPQERKVMELALEALETLHDENMDYIVRNKLGGENNQCMVFARDVIKSIKRTLAQPEQEQQIETLKRCLFQMQEAAKDLVKQAKSLPSTQRTWVGLTPQERDEINEQVYGAVPHHVAFHHAIEAKLKEKNNE